MLRISTDPISRSGSLRRAVSRVIEGMIAVPLALALLCPTSASHAAPPVASPGAPAAPVVPGGSKQIPNYPSGKLGHSLITTYHNDNQRTGSNPNETTLYYNAANTKDPRNTNFATGFGKLFTRVVDGAVYAQPLFVSDLPVTNIYDNQTVTHKGVVFVVTENNSIYAFDADSNTGTNAGPLYTLNFNFPNAEINPVPGTDIIDQNSSPQQDIEPIIGITGTPVIDPATSTMYVLVRTKEYSTYYHRIHAIDITTGLEKFNSPVDLGDNTSVPGTGDGTDGNGNVFFDTLFENQRPALTLSNGVLYISYGAFDNIPPYHGWIFGFNTTTLNPVSIFNTTPNASYSYLPFARPVGGGVDMSGAGLATDTAGNLYLSTGTGLFDANTGGTDYAESILKLNPTGLSVSSYFTPNNFATLNANNLDLGTGGVVVLPDSAGIPGHPHLLAAAGVEGKIYLLDRDKLGGYVAGADTQIPYSRRNSTGPIYGVPALMTANNTSTLFYHGSGDSLRSFQIVPNSPTGQFLNNTATGFRPSKTPNGAPTPVTYGYPGGIPSVSFDSTAPQGAIVWDVEGYATPNGGTETNPQGTLTAVLHAYSASTLQELYNSNTKGATDQAGPYIKFTVPTVANGKVFVGGNGTLTVYGQTTGAATGIHYVIAGPNFFTFVNNELEFLQVIPALIANRNYDFSITAVGPDGNPISLNTTVKISLNNGSQNYPIGTATFSNSSNTIFSTAFTSAYTTLGEPGTGGEFHFTVTDSNGNSNSQEIDIFGQTTVGFDHYVLRAPKAVKDGTLTQVAVSAQNINGVPVTLPGDFLMVYDTLPAGTQPYLNSFVQNSINLNLPPLFSPLPNSGFLPDDASGILNDGIGVTQNTSATGLSFEFQAGLGDYSLFNVNSNPVTIGGGTIVNIPVRLHGVGKHVVIISGTAISPAATPSTGTIPGFAGFTATAVITVTP